MKGIRLLIIGLSAASACQEAQEPLPTTPDVPPLFARPTPPPGTGPISVTLHAQTVSGLATTLLSDGRGPYVHNTCGVSASIGENAGTLFMYLTPAGTTPPASCGGPRSATVRMVVRHLSDDPHVDDPTSPIGDLSLGNMAVGLNGVAKINAPTLACFHSTKSGKGMSGIGMRFNPAVYPGSDYLMVTTTGNRLWHIETAPYPDNVGYCEGDLGVSFWHMEINLDIHPAS